MDLWTARLRRPAHNPTGLDYDIVNAKSNSTRIDEGPRKEGQPSAAHTSARPLKDKQTSKARSAVEQTEARSGAHSPRMHSRQFQSSSSTRFGWSLTVKLVSASPNGASCAPSFGAVQWPPGALLFHRALLANTSLNRTFCCGRHLAFISFSAKYQPPQNAG